MLDYPSYFEPIGRPLPDHRAGILAALEEDGLLRKNDAGSWNITNLGAVLFAKRLTDFGGLGRKAVRVIVYEGGSRLKTLKEQVEPKGYLFKEWKSYANLHKFDTANEHIAAGLIWASLCAAILKRFLAHAAQRVGGKPISTRRVAMCARHIMDELVAALLASVSIAAAVRDGLAFLL
ncbi:MAG TPA: hypothetical protein VHN14_06250, partial [Kofleriaceae bacterium]|nr:hypothetical protein [Kofleriaceae bacterium]